MTILALEFSSPQRSVAVARGEKVFAETVETGGRGTNAFGMIEKVLAEAKTEREEIDTIAVGLGPGSYTGIRAAIAIAQGWRLARETNLIGIGSIEVMAAQAQAEKIFGRVNVIVDAQQNEFYLATFEISESGRKEVESLKILSFAKVQSRANAREILMGPEVAKWFPSSRTVFPQARMLGELAASGSNSIVDEEMTPIYLRETNFVKAPPARLANLS
jgi:tRNA threonylcarbamoyladenosine biosynthesis protein TsaB